MLLGAGQAENTDKGLVCRGRGYTHTNKQEEAL